MVKTVCGVDLDKDGFLITVSKNLEPKKKPAVLIYNHQQIYFCEEACKIEFLNAANKEEWMKNHK